MTRNETFGTLLALTWLTACGEGENGTPDAGGGFLRGLFHEKDS